MNAVQAHRGNGDDEPIVPTSCHLTVLVTFSHRVALIAAHPKGLKQTAPYHFLSRSLPMAPPSEWRTK
jgi:hypothetical protein